MGLTQNRRLRIRQQLALLSLMGFISSPALASSEMCEALFSHRALTALVPVEIVRPSALQTVRDRINNYLPIPELPSYSKDITRAKDSRPMTQRILDLFRPRLKRSDRESIDEHARKQQAREWSRSEVGQLERLEQWAELLTPMRDRMGSLNKEQIEKSVRESSLPAEDVAKLIDLVFTKQIYSKLKAPLLDFLVYESKYEIPSNLGIFKPGSVGFDSSMDQLHTIERSRGRKIAAGFLDLFHDHQLPGTPRARDASTPSIWMGINGHTFEGYIGNPQSVKDVLSLSADDIARLRAVTKWIKESPAREKVFAELSGVFTEPLLWPRVLDRPGHDNDHDPILDQFRELRTNRLYSTLLPQTLQYAGLSKFAPTREHALAEHLEATRPKLSELRAELFDRVFHETDQVVEVLESVDGQFYAKSRIYLERVTSALKFAPTKERRVHLIERAEALRPNLKKLKATLLTAEKHARESNAKLHVFESYIDARRATLPPENGHAEGNWLWLHQSLIEQIALTSEIHGGVQLSIHNVEQLENWIDRLTAYSRASNVRSAISSSLPNSQPQSLLLAPPKDENELY